MKNTVISMFILAMGMNYTFHSNAEANDSQQQPEQWYYLSSSATDEVYRFEEDSGELLGVLDQSVPGAFASFIGLDGDLFVATQKTGAVLRFDGITGEYLGEFIEAGSGGLSRPTAPLLTPDGKYLIVGDLDLNGYLRFDGQTGEYIGVFADPSTSPINGPFMPIFSPYPEFAGKILFASGFTNSIQVYDIESGNYERDLVEPGSGGLSVPIGLDFGPDGNLYTSSAGTSSVKRYDGQTGAYIDDFVPTGSAGLKNPRAIEFGGTNSNLYVVSNDTNNVLVYDRITGDFLSESSSGSEAGFLEPRGLIFTARPNFYISTTAKKETANGRKKKFAKVTMNVLSDNDTTDSDPEIELVSITVDDPDRDVSRDIRGARFGTDDRTFRIRNRNYSNVDRVYTVTYRATNNRGGMNLATDTITIEPTYTHN
jgi:DNA-binding beta-propeller fold protein YncE